MPIPDEVDVANIRRGLELTQASFCLMFGFSLDTLKHWESERRKPDSAARAYLTVIEADPLSVMFALGIDPDASSRISAIAGTTGSRNRTKEKAMTTISAEEFKNALVILGKPGGKQRVFLNAHAKAAGRAMNAEGLAKVVNYKNWRAINLHYGKLALDLGNIMQQSHSRLELLCEYAGPGTLTNKEGILVMRPEFAEALRLAEWI